MGKRFRKRRSGLKSQVYKNKKSIKRLNQAIEYKFFDGATVEVAVNSTGTVTYLNTIAEGITNHTRTGGKITFRRVLIRAIFENDNGTPADGVARILLVRKIANEGASPSIATILYNHNDDATTVTSNRNMERAENLKVYFDHTFAYDTLLHSEIPFKISQKLNSNCEYNGATGVVGTCIDNGLYLVALGTEAAGANAPVIQLDWRVTYCDM